MSRLQPQFVARVVQNARYLPRTISMLEDWFPFTVDYLALGLGHPRPLRSYSLRGGSTVRLQSPVNTMTLGEIFLRRDYGTLKDNSIVVDVGAHIGLFALYAATTARNTRVYAYEPMPANMNLLKENITHNRLQDRIIPRQAALAGARGPRRFYTHPTDVQHTLHQSLQHEAGSVIEIDCLSLADVFTEHGLTHCDLLKMDCEGAEYEALYNTPADYLQRIKAIRMEYHRGVGDNARERSTPEALADFLRQHGFRITRFEDTDSWLGLMWADRTQAIG